MWLMLSISILMFGHPYPARLYVLYHARIQIASIPAL